MFVTLAAAALAAITLAALLAVDAFGWWWADPAAALIIAGFLAVEAVRWRSITASDEPPLPFRSLR